MSFSIGFMQAKRGVFFRAMSQNAVVGYISKMFICTFHVIIVLYETLTKESPDEPLIN